MENKSESITPGEFERGITLITASMDRGFKAMNGRFDRIEDRQNDHAERIAVLESNVLSAAGDAARDAVREHITKRRRAWAGWGTAAGTFAAAAFEVIRSLFFAGSAPHK